MKNEKEQTVYFSQHCTFFGNIKDIKKNEEGRAVCPHCNSSLYKMKAEDWDIIVLENAQDIPGHKKFMEWVRGKCFINSQLAVDFYNRHVLEN